jgi:DNA processing protein
MVVPGHPLQPEYAGSNELLADGAHPVLRVEDVLEELEGLPRLEDARSPRRAPGADRCRDGEADRRQTDARTRVLSALAQEPRPPEAVAFDLGLPLGAVLATLTELELLGLAKACPGQRFSLPPPPKDKEGRKKGRSGAAGGDG